MSRFRFMILLGILLFTLISFVPLFAGESNSVNKYEEEYPVICVPCEQTDNVSISADTQTVYPGHHATIPVYLHSNVGIYIDRIHLKLSLESGLSYYGYDTTGVGWGGTISSAGSGGQTVEIQFEGNGTYYFSGGPSIRIINLIITAADAFSSSKAINRYSADFPEVHYWQETGECVTEFTAGAVKTYSGSCGFISSVTTGYSYQAQDDNDAAKDTLIRVPIIFKNTFPVDSFKIGIGLADSLEFVGADNADTSKFISSGASTASLIVVNDSFYIQDYSTHYPANSRTTLGWLRFVGANYKQAYTNASYYNHTDNFTFRGNSSCKVHCDSSAVSIGWQSFSDTVGGVYYPVYSCTTSISNSTVNGDSKVTIPVRAKHSFWSQYYRFYIKFDTTWFFKDSVSVEMPNDPSHALSFTAAAITGYSQNYKVWRVQALDDPDFPQYGKYNHPNANEALFNIVLTAKDTFTAVSGRTSRVYFDTSGRTNQVWSYFEPEGETNKITRIQSDTAHFHLNSGLVTMPNIFNVALDTQSCGDVVSMALKVTKVNNSSWTQIFCSIELDDTLYYKLNNPSFVADGDFAIDSIIQEGCAFNNCYSTSVSFKFRKNTINHPGVLAHFKFKRKNKPPTSQELVHLTDFSCLFWAKGQLQDQMDATKMVDGLILASSPKLDPDEGESVPIVPQVYTLNQNYPNPFNLKTTIVFGIPQAGNVSLNIFDILGRHVKSGLNSYLEAGEHQYIWDGTNDAGATVSTGFYIYNLQSGEFRQTKKMLLLK
jgi:hypothetical protein